MAGQKTIDVEYLIQAIDYIKLAKDAGDYQEIEDYCDALRAVAEAYENDPAPSDPDGQYQKECDKFRARKRITAEPRPPVLDDSCRSEGELD